LSFAQRDRIDQQDVFIDQVLGDDATREGGASVGENRLALHTLQFGDFVGQVAAGDIGLRPAFCAGLKRPGLFVAGLDLGVPELIDGGGDALRTAGPCFEKTALGIWFIGGENTPVEVGKKLAMY
jgi:hypothetical protein